MKILYKLHNEDGRFYIIEDTKYSKMKYDARDSCIYTNLSTFIEAKSYPFEVKFNNIQYQTEMLAQATTYRKLKEIIIDEYPELVL